MPSTMSCDLSLWARDCITRPEIVDSTGLHGKTDKFTRNEKKLEKERQNQAAEMKGSMGLLDIFFPPSISLSFHPLCYAFALFAKKGRSSLTDWRGDDAGASVQAPWVEWPRARVVIRMWSSQGFCVVESVDSSLWLIKFVLGRIQKTNKQKHLMEENGNVCVKGFL